MLESYQKWSKNHIVISVGRWMLEVGREEIFGFILLPTSNHRPLTEIVK
jgi:hypothetical protein